MSRRLMPVPINKERRVDDPWKARVEGKLDALTTAMTDLVAVQRDVHHFYERIARVEARQDKQDERVQKVASDEKSSSGSSATFEKIILTLLASGVGILGTMLVSRGIGA